MILTPEVSSLSLYFLYTFRVVLCFSVACFYRMHLDWIFILTWLDLVWFVCFFPICSNLKEDAQYFPAHSGVGSSHSDHPGA